MQKTLTGEDFRLYQARRIADELQLIRGELRDIAQSLTRLSNMD